MKLLIDECLARLVADRLTAAGHDAIHVSDRSLLGRPDDTVLDLALREGRVVISGDTDFGELLAKSGARTPSVVLLRRTSHRPAEQAALLITNLPALEADLTSGAIIVISDDRIRVPNLPVKPPRPDPA